LFQSTRPRGARL